MQRHLVIGAVQIGLVAAGAIHSGARVVWNDQPRRPHAVFECRHVAVDPVAQVLAERGTRKRVRAGAENGDEQLGRRDLARVRVVERDRVAGPVHEHLLAGAVLLAQNHILVPAPAFR